MQHLLLEAKYTALHLGLPDFLSEAFLKTAEEEPIEEIGNEEEGESAIEYETIGEML